MNEPIRVLHVLGKLNRGGAENMVMSLYRNLDRSKIQFDFVKHTIEKCALEDEIIDLGGKIYSIPHYNGINHFMYKQSWLKFFIENPEYRIIHGHVRSTASIYLDIAKKNGLATIAHSHSTSSRGKLIERLVKNIMQFKIRYIADYFFACSEEAGKWLYGKKILKNENFKVIKNAIVIDDYSYNEKTRSKVRKLLGVEEKIVIGHVGNFTEPKNHKYLIDIFNSFQKEEKNAVLLLVGDGHLRNSILEYIKKLQIEEKVILTGSVKDVQSYLQAMDIFVFPSKFEGLGIAIIEAQTSGLPCLISHNIPQEVIVTNLVHKLSIDEKPVVWSTKVKRICKDVTRREDFSDAIKDRGYDIKCTSTELSAFYENIFRSSSTT